jgi:hypothetical protein
MGAARGKRMGLGFEQKGTKREEALKGESFLAIF